MFGDAEKETFRKILFKQLKFSGLRALAWCFRGNHFHLLLEIPDREQVLEGWTEEDLIGRLSVFRDEYSTKLVLGELEMFRNNGHAQGITEIAGRVRARLFDLSVFMKELKLKMTMAYNYGHGRKGTLWEGRFKSVLVEERFRQYVNSQAEILGLPRNVAVRPAIGNEANRHKRT